MNDNGQTMYIMAQSGRTVLGYQMPRDLSAFPSHYYQILYFLGSADILQRSNRFKFTLELRQHLSFLTERKFETVVILPPVFDQRKIGSKAFRDIIIAVCDEKQIPYIDVNEVWDINWTTDGRHPSDYGHEVLAQFITENL
jgi:hypothetical protein